MSSDISSCTRGSTRLPGDVTARELEKEADAFASALLMPRRDLLAHSGAGRPGDPPPAGLPQGVGVRDHARLHELGRLTDWAYRQNCVQSTQRGFRVGEPGGRERERSRVFSTAFRLLRDEGITVRHLADDLGLHAIDIHSITFGQVAVAVTGRAGQATAPAAKLHLVR